MSEFLKLKNGNKYQLVIDGYNTYKNCLSLAFVTADKTLEDIQTEFVNMDNIEKLIVETETEETISIFDGFGVLDSRISLDTHYEITPAEYGEDGAIIKEAVYGKVAFLSLYKESVEEKIQQMEIEQEVTAQAVQDLILMTMGGE